MIRLLTEKIILLVGMTQNCQKARIVVERFQFKVSQDDAREILVDLCQFGSACEGAGIAFKLLVRVSPRAGEILAFPEDLSLFWKIGNASSLLAFGCGAQVQDLSAQMQRSGKSPADCGSGRNCRMCSV